MHSVAGEDNHTYIKNVKDTIVSGGGTDFVSVNLTTGLLGHATSSRRYKEDIKSMDNPGALLSKVTDALKTAIDTKPNNEDEIVQLLQTLKGNKK